MNDVKLISPGATDIRRWKNLSEAGGAHQFFMRPEIFRTFADTCMLVVGNDFEFVLPLSVRKKFCISYLHQIPFIQRLSAVGSIDADSVSAVAGLLKKKFPLIHIDTDVSFQHNFNSVKKRNNFILPLSESYDVIRENNFSSDCRKNIEKADNRGCIMEASNDWNTIIDNYHQVYGQREGNHLKNSYHKARSFLHQNPEGCCEGYRIVNEKKELLFSGIIVKGRKRIYYWLGAPTPAGRQARATYYFISEIIRKYANTPFIFDFEGSDFPGVAKFYNGFTKQSESYYEVCYRRFPLL